MHEHRNLLDWIAAGLAMLASAGVLHAVSVTITVLAAIGSLSLVLLRWHDRLKYGPYRGRE